MLKKFFLIPGRFDRENKKSKNIVTLTLWCIYYLPITTCDKKNQLRYGYLIFFTLVKARIMYGHGFQSFTKFPARWAVVATRTVEMFGLHVKEDIFTARGHETTDRAEEATAGRVTDNLAHDTRLPRRLL